jgi:hypothetical protein
VHAIVKVDPHKRNSMQELQQFINQQIRRLDEEVQNMCGRELEQHVQVFVCQQLYGSGILI